MVHRVSTSGGLEYGPRDGPWIDIVPIPPRRLDPADAIEAAKGPLEWQTWREFVRAALPGTISPQIRKMRGLVGVGSNMHIRFLHERRQSVLDVLYAIEETEIDLPPALVGATLAATQARRLPTVAPMIFARTCDLQPPGQRTHSNRRQIETMVDHYIAVIVSGGNVLVPGGAVDRARFWLAAAHRLWQPEVRPRIARSEISLEAKLMAGALAAAWLELQAVDVLEVAGTKLQVSNRVVDVAWPQALEWARSDIHAEALRYLVDNRMPCGKRTVDRVAQAGDPIPIGDNPALCRGLAATLLREAEEQAAYAPVGGFLLALPTDYPLRAWAVEALRVWAHPNGLWVAVVTDDDEVGASFSWRPGEPFMHWIVAEQADPILQVTLAALWRDLRVAGEDAVPVQRERGSRPATDSAPPDGVPSPARQSDPTLRTLPSVWLRGLRTWGDRVEREYIRRRTHGVRGHLRRLPLGWSPGKPAKKAAEEFGIALPEGYTFVRPYYTGSAGDGEGEELPTEVVIRARGLASVMTILSEPRTNN